MCVFISEMFIMYVYNIYMKMQSVPELTRMINQNHNRDIYMALFQHSWLTSLYIKFFKIDDYACDVSKSRCN